MTGADLIVDILKSQGVPFIATLAGNGLDPLYAACQRGGMRLVDFRNEQAAAYAADVYARLTGRLGVCAVSSGVAHISAMAGLVNAYFDGAPVLLISGCSESERIGAGSFQDMDQVAIAAPLCKYAKLVDRVERLPFFLREAISRAMLGRMGPVHLTIPIDVSRAEVDPALLSTPAVREIITQPPLPGDPDLIYEAVSLLEEARRPLIVAGSAAFYAGVSDVLDDLATTMQIPVVTPIWDRGSTDAPSPYFMGVVGAVSGEPRLLADADLVILLGAQVDYRTGYMEPPAVFPAARVIRIDLDPESLYQGVEPDLAIHGDPLSVLLDIIDDVRDRGLAPKEAWLAEAGRRDRAFREKWANPGLPVPAMTGQHLVEALRPVVDEEAVFLVDGGNIGQWAHMLLGDRYPAHWLTCGASGVIGWGIGGGIAARLVYPDRPVILLTGDGSFGFTLGDLETAVRQCTPFVAVVADDRAWGIVASGQQRRERDLVACELGAVRYDLVAEGLGALGLRAETPEEVVAAVRQGIASGRPTVVHVPIARGGPAD